MAKDPSKSGISLSASTPEPVKLDKANCWCLCFGCVFLPLLSSLQGGMCLPLNLKCVSIEGNIADSYWTRPEFRISECTYRTAHAHMEHFEALRGFLPTLSLYHSESVGACGILENDTVQRRTKKDSVQLRPSVAPPSPIFVLSLCHQGDIAQGTRVFFIRYGGSASRLYH